jgi:hypothetical protein
MIICMKFKEVWYLDSAKQHHPLTVPALRPCSGGDRRGHKKEGAQPEITIEYTTISLHN